RMDRVDRDVAERQIAVGIAVGDLVAAAALETRLELQSAFLRKRRDVRSRIENLDVGVRFEIGGSHDARSLLLQVERLGTLTVHPEGDLLEVENDVGHVLDHTGQGRELVQHALDANRGDRGSFDRGEQHATECIADRRAEATLERLGNETAVIRSQGFGVVIELLGFLEIGPEHVAASSQWCRTGALACLRRNRVWAGEGACPTPCLLRVEFDDELLLDRQTDVFALRKIHHGAEELLRVQLKPRRNAAARCRFDGLADLIVLPALLANLDDVPLTSLEGGNVDLLAVHLDVTVANELTRLSARGGKAQRVDDVVETKLELAEQVLAGDSALLLSTREVGPELALQKTINTLDLLLFTKLHAVAENLRTAAAMLARCVVAALDGALVLEATITFEKQLHALAPAEPANGIRVTSHYASFGSHPPHHWDVACTTAAARRTKDSNSVPAPRVPVRKDLT